jgi:hypothetical protein
MCASSSLASCATALRSVGGVRASTHDGCDVAGPSARGQHRCVARPAGHRRLCAEGRRGRQVSLPLDLARSKT